MHKVILCGAVAGAMTASAAAAEFELSVYSGWQTSPHSRVSGNHPDGGTYNGLIGWDGKSFQAPPYYGLRGTWWNTERSGWALELTHAKVYAPAAERAPLNFSRLEFTDGLNLITANYMRRWPGKWGNVTPYVGAGLGIALPHVDVTTTGGARTYGYQMTGPAARLIAGASYKFNDRWNMFGEYQFTMSSHKATLQGGAGGTLNTRIVTNAINIGVGYSF